MKNELRSDFSTRQYMLSKDFELYYYSDKNLTSVEDHAHDYWEFYFFLEGDVEMYIQNKPHALKHGDIIIIPPGTRHHARIRQTGAPYRRFILWISRDYIEHLGNISTDYLYLMQRTATEKTYVYSMDDFSFNSIQAGILSLLEEIHSRRFGRNEKIRVTISDLLLNLNRSFYEKLHAGEVHEATLYEQVARFIESHIDEDLSLDRLAGEFFVSKYHISHIFRDNMGFSVHQYILKKRLSMSRDAILNGMDAGEAAAAYGFSDYSVFYRAFVKEYAVSPTHYRQKVRQNLSESLTTRPERS